MVNKLLEFSFFPIAQERDHGVAFLRVVNVLNPLLASSKISDLGINLDIFSLFSKNHRKIAFS